LAPRPQLYRARDGRFTAHVRYRVAPKSNPVKDTFGPFDDDPDGAKALAAAAKFARLIDRIGGAAARAARQRGDDSDRGMPTLAGWLNTHLERLAASATPGTVADYRRMAERTWLPALGHLPLDTIDAAAVNRWVAAQRLVETRDSKAARRRALAAQRATGTNPDTPPVRVPEPVCYSPKSIANAQRFLSTVLASAVTAGHITGNPARGVALPSDAETREMVFLSANEFTTLHGHVRAHYRLFVAFLVGTGCRFGEATAVRWGDFDLDADTPVVRISRAWKKGATGVYLGSTKSMQGKRTITLPAGLVRELRAVRGAPDDLAFTTVEGMRIQAPRFRERTWWPAVVASGIGKRPRVHDLRHTHVSWLIDAGVNFKVIQYRLGHKSVKTTIDRYGHLASDAHTGAADAADVAMAGVLPQVEPVNAVLHIAG